MWRFTLVLTMAITSLNTNAQKIIVADLNEIIRSAQTGSSVHLLAKTRLENQYWRLVSFQSLFKPQISAEGTFPSLNRSIAAITLPDGSEAFVDRSFMTNSVGVRIDQLMLSTGGSFFVSTELERLDLLGSSIQQKSKSYLSAPFTFGFSQPIFQFNQLKWDKELINLDYEKAEKTYVEDYEQIALEAINRFFDLYLTNLLLATTQENQIYLDSLSIIAKERFKLGRISETEMLQVELSARNSDTEVAQLLQESQNKNESLRDYLSIREEVIFELNNPGEIESYFIDEELALKYARENRSEITDYRIRLLQVEMDLERAKKFNSPQLNLFGRFGLTNTTDQFSKIFNSLKDQESITMRVNIPIADWGRSRAQQEIARSSLRLEKIQLEEDEINFEREIKLLINQIELVAKKLDLASSAFNIAEKRVDIAKKRYRIGKLDATNLNIAIQEHSSAKNNYYQTLWDRWAIHQRLRLFTLYDFQKNELISKKTD